MLRIDKRNAETHEDQGGVEILVVLLHVVGIVLRCLSFVHRVEVKPRVIVLDRLEEHPQGLLDAIWSRFNGPRNRIYISRTTGDQH